MIWPIVCAVVAVASFLLGRTAVILSVFGEAPFAQSILAAWDMKSVKVACALRERRKEK